MKFQEDFMSTILEKVQEVIVDRLGVEKEEITVEASFKDDLGADSLDTVELIMELEETFDIEIADEDAEGMQTVGDVIKYIEANQE